MSKKFLALIAIVMCFVAAAPAAYAAEANPQLPLQVKVDLKGTLPNPAEAYNITLTADDTAFPMPAGSDNGTCSVSVTGASTAAFPAIQYDRVGIYTYKVVQAPGSNSKCTYDKSVYLLTVYVTNAEGGSGLDLSATVYKEGSDTKLPEIVFNNVYETAAKGPQTGDDIRLMFMVVACAIALAGMAVAAGAGRRRKHE